ncbi:hypothetical protein TRM7557_01745 [Tritonibacter multivorans]|uniref:Uncharacterized protein n=1 Tax=Tritonibacter multivorans TaxID=928856 RepID=A0A0P1GSL1_9RHOB|nr:hypothetical protein [Tritonibacter multivorans]MDA7422943.1 hypothetical protein [Tritonibacter multivorans]CUH78147.1 hypothetical protein TRM7557_01745 [Tritonibacter multivorans]SFD74885.1 hypothetical protein SAMN04488049_1262 [Tritonibacter multivorans]
MKKILALSTCLIALTSMGGVLLSEVNSQLIMADLEPGSVHQVEVLSETMVPVASGPLRSVDGQVASLPEMTAPIVHVQPTTLVSTAATPAETTGRQSKPVLAEPTPRPKLRPRYPQEDTQSASNVHAASEPKSQQIRMRPRAVPTPRAQQAATDPAVNERAPDTHVAQRFQLPYYVFQSNTRPKQAEERVLASKERGLWLWREARPSHELGAQVGVYR